MKKIAILLTALLAGCSDTDAASKALNGAGYTNVQLTGYVMMGCGESDQFSTGFKALGPTGKPVDGVVCSGWMKGATIRTF